MSSRRTLLALALLPLFAAPATAAPNLQFRQAVECASGMPIFTTADSGSSRMTGFCVAETDLLDRNDVAGIARQAAEPLTARIIFTDAGKAKLAAAPAGRLAIFIDGRLLAAPMLAAPVTGGVLDVVIEERDAEDVLGRP